MDTRPIGVFDSGLGGVSVLREAVRMLPGERFVYYGDNKNAPYGDRTEEEITKLTMASAKRLAARDIKALIIACNTATATCISDIRSALDIPVVSVEPAIKPACERPGNGSILMLATLATTRLARYLALQSRMPKPERVINVPCPGLVERIEGGIFADDAFDDVLAAHLGKYEGMAVDGVVLGCTHYIFIKGAIRRYCNAHFTGEIEFFDGNAATVRQLDRVLRANDAKSVRDMLDASDMNDISHRVEFHTSGDPRVVRPVFEMLLNAR